MYIVCGYTDMRRGIDGLAAIVQQNYQLNPYSASPFLFCGKRRDRLKALLWEQDGFVLLYKRLNGGNYQWPRRPEEARNLTWEQFAWLTQGLSIAKGVKPDGSKAAQALTLVQQLFALEDKFEHLMPEPTI